MTNPSPMNLGSNRGDRESNDSKAKLKLILERKSAHYPGIWRDIEKLRTSRGEAGAAQSPDVPQGTYGSLISHLEHVSSRLAVFTVTPAPESQQHPVATQDQSAIPELKRRHQPEADHLLDMALNEMYRRIGIIYDNPEDPEEPIPPILEVVQHILSSYHPSRREYQYWVGEVEAASRHEELPEYLTYNTSDADEPAKKTEVRLKMFDFYYDAFHKNIGLTTHDARIRAEELLRRSIDMYLLETESNPDQYNFRLTMGKLKQALATRITELEWQIPGTVAHFTYYTFTTLNGWYVPEPKKLRLLPFKEYISRSFELNSVAYKVLQDNIKRHKNTTNRPQQYEGELDADPRIWNIQQEILEHYVSAFTPCDCNVSDINDNLRHVEEILCEFKKLKKTYPEIFIRLDLRSLFFDILSGYDFRIEELKWMSGDEAVRYYYENYAEEFAHCAGTAAQRSFGIPPGESGATRRSSSRPGSSMQSHQEVMDGAGPCRGALDATVPTQPVRAIAPVGVQQLARSLQLSRVMALARATALARMPSHERAQRAVRQPQPVCDQELVRAQTPPRAPTRRRVRRSARYDPKHRNDAADLQWAQNELQRREVGGFDLVAEECAKHPGFEYLDEKYVAEDGDERADDCSDQRKNKKVRRGLFK